MPSFTSNSDMSISRIIPDKDWPRVLAAVLAAVFTLCLAWELLCRAIGYMPTLNDNPYQWALVRKQVNTAGPDDIVVIGSSRGLFDLRLDELKKIKGGQVYQLSIVGSSPVMIMEDLADNTSFNGTLIVEVTPALFFAPGGPPMDKPTTWLKFYRELSPSQIVGQYIGIFLQQRLAFIQQEDLTLPALLDLIPVKDRPDARVMPKFPPFLNTLETDRQAALIDKLVTQPAYARRVQHIWQGLFGALPAAPDESAGMVIGRYHAAMNTLRARGVNIIFIRPPSTQWLLEKEAELTPRARFWDRLLKETGAPGIHFEDYPDQAGLQCPEWSHITKEESIRYTKSLVQIINDMLK